MALSRPLRSLAAPAAGLLAACFGLAGCTSPLLDAPESLRRDKVPLAPLFSPFFARAESDDGRSASWSALFWLLGADREADRSTARALPFWWHGADRDSRTTVVFPLYFGHEALDDELRFFTPLWGYRSSLQARHDWFLFNLFDVERSRLDDAHRSGLFLVYDWRRHAGPRRDFTLVPIFGLAHLAQFNWGHPPEGATVPALDRQASRRVELLNLFGFLHLFGYDDVGDRREWRLLSLFGSELLSPLRSWRGRGDDPNVSEWLVPLYMNRQDASGGWLFVGPLWGWRADVAEDRETDWWLLGLFSRTRQAGATTWKVLGLPVSESPAQGEGADASDVAPPPAP